MTDVTISSHNHSAAFLNCDDGIKREVSDRFTFKPEGYMFTPAYKSGMWNGEIRPVCMRTGRFPKGLVPDVIDFLESSEYTVGLVNKDFASFAAKHECVDVDTLNLGFEPRDFQLAAVNRVLTKKRQVILSPTGSGKSLILYMLVRSLVKENILIIVPNISLVSQLYSDFEDYSKNDEDWNTIEHCQTISEGATKEVTKRCTLATWQSIYNIRGESWFEHFDAVFVDECLHPDTIIRMGDESSRAIKDVVVGDYVKTVNESTGEIESKEVLKVHHNLSVNEQMYEIETEDGRVLKITGNHKVLTQRGWVRTDELELSDSIHSFN